MENATCRRCRLQLHVAPAAQQRCQIWGQDVKSDVEWLRTATIARHGMATYRHVAPAAQSNCQIWDQDVKRDVQQVLHVAQPCSRCCQFWTNVRRDVQKVLHVPQPCSRCCHFWTKTNSDDCPLRSWKDRWPEWSAAPPGDVGRSVGPAAH